MCSLFQLLPTLPSSPPFPFTINQSLSGPDQPYATSSRILVSPGAACGKVLTGLSAQSGGPQNSALPKPLKTHRSLLPAALYKTPSPERLSYDKKKLFLMTCPRAPTWALQPSLWHKSRRGDCRSATVSCKGVPLTQCWVTSHLRQWLETVTSFYPQTCLLSGLRAKLASTLGGFPGLGGSVGHGVT